MPEQGWPAPSRRVGRFLGALAPERRQLLFTRGVFVARMVVPQPAAEGWFRWICEPPQMPDNDWTYYIDGSLIDGPSKLFSRAGFAIVVVKFDGTLVGYASGCPPSWIRSAAAAEAWALFIVLRCCPPLRR